MKKHRATAILLAKIGVSAGLLAFFLSKLDFSHFWETLSGADLGYVSLAMVAYLVGQVISAVRWTVLSRPLGFNMGLSGMTAYYFIGMFFNLFAPGTVGGDLSKIYYLTREGQQDGNESWGAATLRAAVSVVADRAVGMCVLVWLGAAGLLLFAHYRIQPAVRSATLALAGGLLLGGLCLPLITKYLPQDSHPLVSKLRVALESYGRHLTAVPIAMALSLIVHLLQAWMHVVMGKALGMELPFSFCIILYPLVGTFAAIPVSFGGIGLRESGYMYLLVALGFASEKGIAFGLLLFIVVAIDSLLGGVLFLVKRKEAPPAAAAVGQIK
jgi:uncharacterized membrane protein YbhN (UPF0104 family)